MISHILGLVTAGRSVAGVKLMQRFLLAVANIVGLLIITAFMLCAALASLFYLVYLGLVHYGLDPLVACIVLVMVQLLLTALLVAFSIDKLTELRDTSTGSLNGSGDGKTDVSSLFHAFIDGFLNAKV